MLENLSRKGLFHLFIVYTVWSTTYLGMRVGVDPANGFPPFLFGALRMGAAALILFAFCGGVMNLGMKLLVQRPRPVAEPTSGLAGPLFGEHGFTSFPSGHSASAFAFAQGVSSVAPALSVPLHAAAAAVAYSRVHTGVHYPGDVVAGSLIGIVTGGTVSRLLNGRDGWLYMYGG